MPKETGHDDEDKRSPREQVVALAKEGIGQCNDINKNYINPLVREVGIRFELEFMKLEDLVERLDPYLSDQNKIDVAVWATNTLGLIQEYCQSPGCSQEEKNTAMTFERLVRKVGKFAGSIKE